MKQPKLFAAAYLLTCAVALVSAAVVNVLGNGSNLFPSPYFPSSSDRAWKTRRLDEIFQTSQHPKVVILGSSRVMQIQPSYVQAITGKTTFNYGVSTGTPADGLAQLRYLLDSGCRPDLVVLGIDEQAFHRCYYPWEVETISHVGLYREASFPENLEIALEALRRIDVGTTRASLDKLIRPDASTPRTVNDVENILLEDGYLLYSTHLRKIEAGTFDLAANIAEDYSHGEVVARTKESLLQPSPRKMARLEEFLSLAKTEGIEVRAMLLPLHPEYEKRFLTEDLMNARSVLSEKLRTICTEYGAAYRDFTDLASFNGDPKEFFDGHHQSSANLRKMVNVLFGLRPTDQVAKVPTDRDLLKHLPAISTLTTQ
jgi:hypothetical protein